MSNQNILPGPEQSGKEVWLYRPESANVQLRTKRELRWDQLIQLLKRNRWLSLAIFCAVMLTVLVVTLMMKPEYRATARVEIDPPNMEAFALEGNRQSMPSDPAYLETQLQVLHSDSLALEVIRKYHLDQNSGIVGPPNQKPSLLQEIRSLLPRRAPMEEQGTPVQGSIAMLTKGERAAIKAFGKRLQVSNVRNTNVVNISFMAPGPRLAAMTANAMLDDYIDDNYRNRYQSAIQETKWLSKELDDLRDRMEKSNAALAEFQNENGIVPLREHENTTTETIEQVTNQLNTARADRIELQADVQTLHTIGVDALAETHKDDLIKDLADLVAQTTGKLEEARAIYGENNANVVKYRNEVAKIQEQLNAERDRIARSVQASYQSAVAREHLLENTLNGMDGKIHEMNKTTVINESLKKEVETNEHLYNDLYTKLREAGISAGLRSGVIRVLDRAAIPDSPVKPELMVNLALGFIVALLLATGIPILKEMLREKLHAPDDVRELTGVAPIGVLPMLDEASKKRNVTAPQAGLLEDGRRETLHQALSERGIIPAPNSMEAESLRNLVTSIKLPRHEKPPRILLVTSSIPGEGKTTVATRLAFMLSQSKPTCLIDGDLRNPSIGRRLSFKAPLGLNQVLAGSSSADAIMRRINGLSILPGGSKAGDPGELISSENMREVIKYLSQQFHYIVIDSPPIIPFADGRALSRLVDGVLMVGRSGVTSVDELRTGLELLEQAQAPVLGVVLNGLEKASPYYRRYKSVYAYSKSNS